MTSNLYDLNVSVSKANTQQKTKYRTKHDTINVNIFFFSNTSVRAGPSKVHHLQVNGVYIVKLDVKSQAVNSILTIYANLNFDAIFNGN